MKDIKLWITIGMIAMPVIGGAYVAKNKLPEIDKNKEKIEEVEKRLLSEEKDSEWIRKEMTEQKADIKDILRLLRENP